MRLVVHAALPFEPLAVPQVEPGLVGRCEPRGAQERAAVYERPAFPQAAPVGVAEFLRPVVPDFRVARSALRHEHQRPVQAPPFLLRAAVSQEHAPSD